MNRKQPEPITIDELRCSLDEERAYLSRLEDGSGEHVGPLKKRVAESTRKIADLERRIADMEHP